MNNKITPLRKQMKSVEAKPWFQVSEKALQLEGLCFDRAGNLYFVEVFGGTLMKLDVQKMKLETVVSLKDCNPAAVKIHKDGRLFIACLGDFNNGGIVIWDPKTGKLDWLLRPEQGYVIDDLVFDSDGGFYFTDFKGKSTDPSGGIYYVYPDEKTIKQVVGNMAVPNGIALTPDERGLWVTEMCANRLHYIELNQDRVTIPPFGTAVPYYFSGLSGPDSCCIDSEGNLYVAMYGQGRFLVFDHNGTLQEEIVLPGSKEGHMLRSTHPMFMPDSDKLIMCANDSDKGMGSWLYQAEGLACAHKFYQFHE